MTAPNHAMRLGQVLLLLFCLQPAILTAAPRVVTSIAPLQEITAALMEGIAEPGLIIDRQASAHHFALKPSHMKQLQQAELLIWISRYFEAGFKSVPEILPASARQLELLPALGLGGDDGHIWYAPTLLNQSIRLIATELIQLDPANRARYRRNANNLQAEVADWQRRLQQRWSGKQFRVLTDHEFLAHFSRDLPMFEVIAMQDHHAAHGGLKDLKRLEDSLQEEPANCLLTLEFPTPLAASFAAKYRLPIVSIVNLDPAKATLKQRLQRLTDALETCLGGGSANTD